MNIFYLHEDTYQCAIAHCDKHVVKMILETAQLLCSAHWMTGGEAPYKLTHKNHPCAVWAREALGHYRWLADLGVELCNEYTHRYGKVHKTTGIIMDLALNDPGIPEGWLRDPPQCMPDHCKHENTVEAYRNYYKLEKAEIAKWKHSDAPDWFSCQCSQA